MTDAERQNARALRERFTWDLGPVVGAEPVVIENRRVTVVVREHAEGWGIIATPKPPKRAPYGQLDPGDARALAQGVFEAQVRRCDLAWHTDKVPADCLGHTKRVLALAGKVKATYS